MLEKPDLQDKLIMACLQGEYGLQVAQCTFLPLGADPNRGVYRVVTDNDPFALAYYRYERIIQDLAVIGEQLLLTDEGGADRERSCES